ncbi:MAG: hypothetical protein IT372_23480 [Polyangiaceae bacterium]|nr:hypothetical protein [Polyangiaceae bacterium]
MTPGALLALATLGAAACAGVLGIKPRARTTFEHRAHVLEGIQCVRCHTSVERAGDGDPIALPGDDSCRSCHTAPHDEGACGGCHGTPAAREGAALAREALRFEHRGHVARLDGDCVRCHVDVQEEGHTLRPTMSTCLSCHEHREQWSAKDCDACHADLKREGSQPEDHLVHDPDFLRGHGARAAADSAMCATCHSQRSCLACHGGGTAPALPERLAFDRPMGAGVHRAGFTARHAEEARGDPGLCTSCHAPRSCAGCHERERVGAGARPGARPSPHPPGWLGLPGQSNDHGRAAWRDPALCASCHGGAGEALCVGCHRVGGVGGNPHAPGFSSRLKPRVDRPCILCHRGAP